MAALGEFFGWEELGVAVVAVARAQEVEQALLGDVDGFGRSCGSGFVRWRRGVGGSGRRGLSVRLDCVRGKRRTPLRMTGFRCGCGLGGRLGWEGVEQRQEAVDHLAGAFGVDGVLAEAVDDGGDGGEDGGSILEDGELQAGDLRVDEDAALGAVGVLEVMVITVVLAAHGGRAAAIAGGSVDVMTLEIGFDVRHGE